MTQIVKTPSFELATFALGNPDAERFALVLPGRLDTKDYPHMQSHVDFLADLGFYAISFDPPGTWESPGTTEIYTATNYLQAIDELIDLHGNKPTLLVGHSRGGAMAMLGSKNPVVKAVIPINASYGAPTPPSEETVRAGFKFEDRDVPGTDDSTKIKRFILPMNYFIDAEKYDPAQALTDFKGPKLIIHGTRDEYTDIGRVREVFAGMQNPKHLYEIDSDHDYRKYPDKIDEVNEQIKSFLAQNSF